MRDARSSQRPARTSAAQWILARSPLQWLARCRGTRGLTVLAYHGVPDGPAFAAQLDWLLTWANPVSLEQAHSTLVHEAPLPKNAVLLTFDDGDRSLLEVGVPLLRERHVPAVAFVVAGLIDTDEPFWWVEVEQLVRAGGAAVPAEELVRELKSVTDAERRERIQRLRDATGVTVRTRQLTTQELRHLEHEGVAVANHSLSHSCLDKCEDPVLKAEVHEADERLSEILGHTPKAFAYPNGNWDGRVRDAVAAAGYDLAFAFDHRIAAVPVGDPLTVSRVRVDSDARLDRFRIRASGLHPWLHHARGKA